MKRIILPVLILAVTCGLTGCGGRTDTAVENYDWKMTVVQSNKGDVAAYAPDAEGIDTVVYHDAIAIDMSLAAENGTVTITDNTNDRSYTGTYKKTDTDAESVIYEMTFDGSIGNAVASMTSYQDGKEIPTLILSVNDHVLNFQAEQ